tara:strand:+ start:332 stop:544 length:213 start_codon:yes stop_codon:yes gene_type:complete
MAAKKRILRMASYSSKEESGRGLNCYETSKIDNTEVFYLTWFKKGARNDLGRPDKTTVDNKNDFMKFLNK